MLLTLVSLIYALVVLFILEDEADVQVRVNELIGSFGIALTSTVAGILGRILLQGVADGMPRDPPRGARRGGRPSPLHGTADETGTSTPAPVPHGASEDTGREPHEPEQEPVLTAAMREAVANMLRLRRDLREAADAFAHFTRVTLSHADHVKSHTEQLLDGFNQHMAAAAERGLDATEAAWQGVAQGMRQEADGVLRNIETAAADAAHRTEEAWRSLVGQIEVAANTAQERLRADAAEMGETLAQLARTNASLGSLANALDDAQSRISTLAERASGANAALAANAAETIAAQQALVDGSKASQAAALESFSRATAALSDAAGQQVAKQTEAWQHAVDGLMAEWQAQRHGSEQATVATRRAVDALIESLATARQGIAGLTDAAAGAVATAESRSVELVNTLGGLAEGAKVQHTAISNAWLDSASSFSAAAREHLERDMAAWRESLQAFDTAANASRLKSLVDRLERLLNTAFRRT